eukprot:TRINITY_DN936_c0_g1_i3.p2 TRINITY_DN936_c0_g1~~TRINITY_DN936_c0_g1_i3.p2  ORF type:complete len:245 (+),score=41.38 TRINITY_DN936_c0_g1_i3:75-809(+)
MDMRCRTMLLLMLGAMCDGIDIPGFPPGPAIPVPPIPGFPPVIEPTIPVPLPVVPPIVPTVPGGVPVPPLPSFTFSPILKDLTFPPIPGNTYPPLPNGVTFTPLKDITFPPLPGGFTFPPIPGNTYPPLPHGTTYPPLNGLTFPPLPSNTVAPQTAGPGQTTGTSTPGASTNGPKQDPSAVGKDEGGAPESEGSSSKTWIIAVAIVCGVAIAAAVAGVVIYHKKKQHPAVSLGRPMVEVAEHSI